MDLRKEKTKIAIKESFMDLMMTNEFNDITVTMLAEHAKIGRKTFYLHYGCIEDVLYDIEHDLERDMNSAVDKYFRNASKDIKNVFLDLNVIIYNNKDLFVRVAKADSYLFFRQMFENLLTKTIMGLIERLNLTNSINAKYYATYYAAGIVRLYFDFLSGETDLDLDTLTYIATRATFLSVDDLVNS